MQNQKENGRTFGVLRAIGLVVVLAGALGSLGFMFYAGRQNKSIFLMTLFTGWVLAPFVALLLANGISKRWSVPSRVTLYMMMLVIPLVSTISYSGVLGPIGPKPAFVFLVAPLISLLLMAAGLMVTSGYSKRALRRKK
jgi:hypothetical protein